MVSGTSLELGSGKSPDPEYDIHVDIDPQHNPDIVADALDLHMFEDNTFDKVKVVDVLEHISYRETSKALKEWHRVMKPGGRIYIQVPECSKAIEMWQRGKLVKQPDLPDLPMVNLAWLIMGGHFDNDYTKDPDTWTHNAHHAMFDVPTLKWYLNEAGFEIESLSVNIHPNILCWAVKK